MHARVCASVLTHLFFLAAIISYVLAGPRPSKHQKEEIVASSRMTVLQEQFKSNLSHAPDIHHLSWLALSPNKDCLIRKG